MSIFLNTGDVNFVNLAKVVSAGFLFQKVTVLFFFFVCFFFFFSFHINTFRRAISLALRKDTDSLQILPNTFSIHQWTCLPQASCSPNGDFLFSSLPLHFINWNSSIRKKYSSSSIYIIIQLVVHIKKKKTKQKQKNLLYIYFIMWVKNQYNYLLFSQIIPALAFLTPSRWLWHFF